jgi:hypothetical protein
VLGDSIKVGRDKSKVTVTAETHMSKRWVWDVRGTSICICMNASSEGSINVLRIGFVRNTAQARSLAVWAVVVGSAPKTRSN